MQWQETLAWHKLIVFMVVVFLMLTAVSRIIKKETPLNLGSSDGFKGHELCPIHEPWDAATDGLSSVELFSNQSFLVRQVERLSAAVNVPTVSLGNGDIESDSGWTNFSRLHTVLHDLFPNVHQSTELEKINKYGLLYTFHGSSEHSQPVVFMAHQDVVPVADSSKWTYPPFEAHYDEPWLWGRGSVDCKDKLIGILSALEELLEQGFQSKRTIILSFGFDEEIGGQRGAKELAAHLEKKYGRDSIAMIFDEGGMGFQQIGDVVYARPAVAEKGFVDIVLSLEMPGGHSSRPPPHTAIGVMARLIASIEDDPLKAHLGSANPYRHFLECQAEHSPKDIEPWLRQELHSGKDLAERIIESRGAEVQWTLRTSQAVDLISGGAADNEIPEAVNAVINYRVLPEDMAGLYEHIVKVVIPVAHAFNVSVDAFNQIEPQAGRGVLTLSAKDLLPPSPLSPTGAEVDMWNVFAGTLRQVFEGRDSTRLVVPVGDMMTGNTDTSHYWALAKNIYRFSPRWPGTTEGVHTVDERIDMRSHMDGIRFCYELMRNLGQHTD